MSVNNFTHVCGLCGETWIGAHICSKRATDVPFRVARLPRALDEASYRAGIEAAASEVDKVMRAPTTAFVDKDVILDFLGHLAACIRALPTPSTMPQEGGEQ